MSDAGEDPKGGRPAEADASVRGVLGRGSLYSLATVAQLGAGLVAIPVLTRVLSPAEYGTLTVALVAQAVLTHLAAFGIPPAISRTFFHDHGPDGARALIGVTAIVAAGVGLIALLTGPLWSQAFSEVEFGTELRLAAISSVASAVLIAAQAVLQAEERVRSYVVAAVIATAGAQGLGVAWALLGGGGAGYLAGFTVGVYLALAYAWFTAGLETRPLRRRPDRSSLLGTALRIGLPTIPHGLALYLLSAGDRVLVERLEGLEAGGSYYIAYTVGSLGIFLAVALNGAWAPSLYGAKEDVRWSFLADSAVALLRVVALVSAAFALAAPIALEIFAPAEYELAGLGDVSALVALSAVPYLWYLTATNIAIWQGSTRILAISAPIAVALNIALCLVLIPPMGLEGAALATLIAYALLGAITWTRARQLVTISWDARALVLAALPALAGVALALALPDDGAWLILRAGLAAIAGLAALRAITSHRTDEIPSAAPS